VPDWTYHPVFKPLLFRLRAETARRVTMSLLAIQAKNALGRRLFRWFGHGMPDSALAVKAFGLSFPAALGVAPGLDIEARAVSVLQYLGVGFVSVGPVGAQESISSEGAEPRRIEDSYSIASSEVAGAPSAAGLSACLAATPAVEVPIGVALVGPDLVAAARALEATAAFFYVPSSAAEDTATLRALRSATKRPLLLMLSASWDDAELDRALNGAVEIGLNGCVALEGEATSMLPRGALTGPFLRDRRRTVTRRIRERFGDKIGIVAAGGIMTPDDAIEALEDGAVLVQLYEGLVYGGPGLPGRIIHRLEARARGEQPKAPALVQGGEPPPELAGVHRWGCRLAAFTGAVLAASGIGALLLASTITFFPYDFAFLGMTADDLCRRNACKIVHFMQHDRVSFGGAILSIGIIYMWLARGPLRRGEPWAFWVLLASGLSGFGSFLLYLGYGYLDVWHGWATLALLPFYLVSLTLCYAGMHKPRGPRELFRQGATAYLWSPAGMGRAAISLAAGGMIMGGLLIMFVGVTQVFVKTDLEYMQITTAELNAISPKLVPLIAHDRSGFGGGLFSGGLVILASIWCGIRPGDRGLWWALLLAGLVGFGCAIGVHPIVGYTSFLHLFPAYVGAIAFLTGVALLYRPMCVAPPGRHFSDIG
jgi:dihydroorotate dehydrogenase